MPIGEQAADVGASAISATARPALAAASGAHVAAAVRQRARRRR